MNQIARISIKLSETNLKIQVNWTKFETFNRFFYQFSTKHSEKLQFNELVHSF